MVKLYISGDFGIFFLFWVAISSHYSGIGTVRLTVGHTEGKGHFFSFPPY